ncbi:phage regulatory CII family protein [Ensifer aridi]|uniref:phage regulatory CII family protein n=1 Tax=Ensifer aridi TaxID=1708715 RepID=UPI000A0FEB6A|nr:phage regulatory CII family protein [Ensifer aridi]
MRFDESLISLKGATEASFKLGGGLTSFAMLGGARVGVSTLSKYASVSEEFRDNVIPVDIAVEADKRAGSPIIIGEAARQLGYGLSPLAGHVEGKPLTEAAALKVLHEANDVSRAIVAAIADGKVDALDRKKIAQETREAIRALQEVLAGLEDAP